MLVGKRLTGGDDARGVTAEFGHVDPARAARRKPLLADQAHRRVGDRHVQRVTRFRRASQVRAELTVVVIAAVEQDDVRETGGRLLSVAIRHRRLRDIGRAFACHAAADHGSPSFPACLDDA